MDAQTFAGPPPPPCPRPTPDLRAAWTRRLREDYDFFNFYYARKRLRPPLLRIGDETVRLGAWDREARCITISERHILAHSWASVCYTLRHEMAHQYADEVLERGAERPHGEAFSAACQVLRVTPESAAGREALEPLESSPACEDAVLARVKKLLALAGSPNEHEAAAAMRMANRLMLEYNLDLVKLQAVRGYEARRLGAVSRRIQEYDTTLALILQDHFFVQVIWVRGYDPGRDLSGSLLEIVGTPENLQMAEYVYHYVKNLQEPLWRGHLREHPDGHGTRRQYLAGLLRGLRAKLDDQRSHLRTESGLVWCGDPRLDEYYRHLHPKIETRFRRGVSRTGRYAAGFGDGRSITIHRGIESATAARGLLLPPGR